MALSLTSCNTQESGVDTYLPWGAKQQAEVARGAKGQCVQVNLYESL